MKNTGNRLSVKHHQSFIHIHLTFGQRMGHVTYGRPSWQPPNQPQPFRPDLRCGSWHSLGRGKDGTETVIQQVEIAAHASEKPSEARR